MKHHPVLPFGLIGGAKSPTRNAFFGKCHVGAAEFDRQARLFSGMFSRTTEANLESARHYHVDPGRTYANASSMFASESILEDRMSFVSVVTPNNSHCSLSAAALTAGFPVMCDKPLGVSFEESLGLAKLVKEGKIPFGISYTYRGYPMATLASELVRGGEIGDVFDIRAFYPQGWLLSEAEVWRTDPEIGGKGGVLADIGATHAYDMIRYVTGLDALRVQATLRTVVRGRKVPDHASLSLDFGKGVIGGIFTSQVSAMCENDIGFEVYGTKGRVWWSIKDCNTLYVAMNGKPVAIYRAAEGYLPESIKRMFRIPPGHPEGNEGALANVYASFIEWVRAYQEGDTEFSPSPVLAQIDDGLQSMALIEAAFTSNSIDNSWVKIPSIS